jgi:ribosomal protein L24E
VSGSSLQWTIKGDETTVDHYVAYISTDGQNLMSLGDINAGLNSVNLCSYSIPNGSYTLFVQAVGKPSMTNQMSGAVQFTSNCTASTTVSFGTNPSSMTIAAGGSGNVTVTAAAQSGAFNNAIALSCSGLPKGMTCSFSPAAITPGAGAVNSVLTVSAATFVSANHRERSHALLATWLFSFGLFGLTLVGRIQRKRIVTVLGACVLAALIVGATSCGGNTASNTVKASNTPIYTVTVNGSSNSVQLSTTVTVTVK